MFDEDGESSKIQAYFAERAQKIRKPHPGAKYIPRLLIISETLNSGMSLLNSMV
jgi:hypothetical protein